MLRTLVVSIAIFGLICSPSLACCDLPDDFSIRFPNFGGYTDVKRPNTSNAVLECDERRVETNLSSEQNIDIIALFVNRNLPDAEIDDVRYYGQVCDLTPKGDHYIVLEIVLNYGYEGVGTDIQHIEAKIDDTSLTDLKLLFGLRELRNGSIWNDRLKKIKSVRE